MSMPSGDNVQFKLSFDEFCGVYKEVLTANGISPHLFKALHAKLEHEVFDAGDYFSLTQDEDADKLKAVVTRDDGIQLSDSNAIFLIDHAWTYRTADARNQLCQCPGLLQRIATLLGYDVHGEVFSPDDDIVNTVMTELWKFNQTYSLQEGSAEEKVPVWYVLDEFGSRVAHSDQPTVAMVPFFYQPQQLAYTLMWPLVDLDYADELTRDFANGERDPLLRMCKLLPWQPCDVTEHVTPRPPTIATDSTFQNRYAYMKETLPDSTIANLNGVGEEKRLKIFLTCYGAQLTDKEHFDVTADSSDVDVLNLRTAIRDFREMSIERPRVLVNQFPCEQLLFNKDLFSAISLRSSTDGTNPAWLPLTFNLHTEFAQFVAHFQRRAAKLAADDGGDEGEGGVNCWICKPWNLARGLQIHVTDDLNQIVRLRETESPQVASEYVSRPVLYHRDDIGSKVKFTMRFTVLMRSVAPLRIYCTDVIMFQFANKEFRMSDFDDYQRHFTVMNYVDGGRGLKQIDTPEFVPQFERQYPNLVWKDLVSKTHECLREFMEAATSRPPPYGVGHYHNSRAMYGFDVLFRWEKDPVTGADYVQPTLLECNFVPDCSRTCTIYPDFVNHVFRFLYSDHLELDGFAVDISP